MDNNSARKLGLDDALQITNFELEMSADPLVEIKGKFETYDEHLLKEIRTTMDIRYYKEDELLLIFNTNRIKLYNVVIGGIRIDEPLHYHTSPMYPISSHQKVTIDFMARNIKIS